MNRKALGRVVSAVTLAVGLALLQTPAPRAAQQKDTVDDVVKAGRQAGAEFSTLASDLARKAASANAQTKPQIDAQIAALKKIQPLVGRLGSDRAFAKEVFDLSVKPDKPGLSSLWSRTLGSPIEIRDIKDWQVYAIYTVNGYSWEVCLSSDASCGGTYGYHRMIGKAKS